MIAHAPDLAVVLARGQFGFTIAFLISRRVKGRGALTTMFLIPTPRTSSSAVETEMTGSFLASSPASANCFQNVTAAATSPTVVIRCRTHCCGIRWEKCAPHQ